MGDNSTCTACQMNSRCDANPGDHRTIRWIGVDNEFLARHLRPAHVSRA